MPTIPLKILAPACLLLALAATYALAKPIWDWDVIPYLYLAYGHLGLVPEAAHTAAYQALQGLPPSTQALLTTSEPFRQTVLQNPASLAQLMPFYTARQGYIGLLAGLLAVGVGPLLAVQLLNLGGQMLLGVTLVLWLRHMRWPAAYQSWLPWLVLALLLVFPSVMKVARWSNPDGLVAATYLLGAYLLWRQQRLWWVAWAACVLLKPTGALLLAPVGVWLLTQRRYVAAAQLAGVGALAALLLLVYPGYGLPHLWQHTFVGAHPFPATLNIPFAWPTYGGYLYQRVLVGLHGRDLLLFAVYALTFALLAWRRHGLGMALACGVALHILAFPGFWERLIIGPVLALGLLVFSSLEIIPKPVTTKRK